MDLLYRDPSSSYIDKYCHNNGSSIAYYDIQDSLAVSYINDMISDISYINDSIIDLSVAYLKLSYAVGNTINYINTSISNLPGNVKSIGDVQSTTDNVVISYTLQECYKETDTWVDTLSSINLPAATTESAGVMTASDKEILDYLKADMDSIMEGDKDLISPSITGTFTIYDNDGNVVKYQTGTSISIERGYHISWNGTWKWTHNDKNKDPESTSGTWGTTLQKSGVQSNILVNDITSKIDGVGSKTIASQIITAPKKGLMVINHSIVSPAEGNDSKSASVSWSTYDVYYYGIVTTIPTTSDEIKNLSNKATDNNWSTVTESNKRYKMFSILNVYIDNTQKFSFTYPANLGELVKITQDGAAPILDAFEKSTVDIILDSGISVRYYVYTTVNPGALKHVKIELYRN